MIYDFYSILILEVKSAYQHLMDEEKRRIVIQNIKEVQKDVRRERKRLLAKKGVG